MKSVYQLVAGRTDAGFRTSQYLLESRPGFLLLIPLKRKWMGILEMVPVNSFETLQASDGKSSPPRNQNQQARQVLRSPNSHDRGGRNVAHSTREKQYRFPCPGTSGNSCRKLCKYGVNKKKETRVW